MNDLQFFEEKQNLKKKKNLKNKFKAALFTVLVFAGIYGIFYVLSDYAKELLLVLTSLMAIVLVYTVWQLIYNEISHTE